MNISSHSPKQVYKQQNESSKEGDPRIFTQIYSKVYFYIFISASHNQAITRVYLLFGCLSFVNDDWLPFCGHGRA